MSTKFPQIQQQSDEWLQWRRQGVTASIVPVLMGESDFDTPFNLYQRYLGLVPEKTQNFAMRKGLEFEGDARRYYEFITDHKAPPMLVVHPSLLFIRASLDGLVESENIPVEIKVPGAVDHQIAKEGQVPKKYYGQVQTQIFVTGAKEGHYLSYDAEKKSGHLVVVKADPEYHERMIPVITKFWKCVETQTPPEFVERDFIEIQDPDALDLASRLVTVRAEMKRLEETYNSLQEMIKDAYGHHSRFRIGPVRGMKYLRRGNVDYTKIPQLKGLDLEAFRKKASQVFSLTVTD